MKIAVLLILALGLWPMCADASVSPCWGVLSLTPWSEAPKPAVLRDSLTDGIVVRAYWDSLETSPGSYRWSWLDNVFATAAAKKIHLIVAPGFYSPASVIAASQTADFLVPDGPLAGLVAPLPLPWDTTYLHQWFQFVDSLGARYGHHPSLGWISLTGPTSFDGEMALPTDSASVSEWRVVAGSDTSLERHLEQAWFQTIDTFNAAFASSGTYFTLALVPNSLPLGDSTLEAQYEADVISYGHSRSPTHFGLQTNGLDGRPFCPNLPPPYHWPVISSYSPMTLTGFQTKDPAELYVCSPRDSVLYYSVLNAAAFDAHFIEIYQANVLDDSLRWAVAFAHEQRTACATASVGRLTEASSTLQVVPNPLHSRAIIRYTMRSRGRVDLGIYDVTGARVSTLARGEEVAGSHEAEFRAARLPSGVYFCRLRTPGRIWTRTLLIMR